MRDFVTFEWRLGRIADLKVCSYIFLRMTSG
jgi:hypothetical protein